MSHSNAFTPEDIRTLRRKYFTIHSRYNKLFGTLPPDSNRIPENEKRLDVTINMSSSYEDGHLKLRHIGAGRKIDSHLMH